MCGDTRTGDWSPDSDSRSRKDSSSVGRNTKESEGRRTQRLPCSTTRRRKVRGPYHLCPVVPVRVVVSGLRCTRLRRRWSATHVVGVQPFRAVVNVEEYVSD